jgi:Concanavalin A-like lectin/glucanases superfamily/Pectate lyase superfamily protein
MAALRRELVAVRVLLLVLLMLSAASTATADITTGLIGWWKFDAGTGTTATDSAGTANATLQNGATWATPGQVGAAALRLDGVNDYAATADTFIGLNGGTAMTLAMWVKLPAAATIQRVIAKSISDGWNTFSLTYNTAGTLSFALNNQNLSQYPQWITNDAVGTGWKCVVATWSRGSPIGAADASMYIGGSSVAVTYDSGDNTYNTSFVLHDLNALHFGIRPVTLTQPFNGDIDEVRVYNRRLSASDASEYCAYTGAVVDVPPTYVIDEEFVCGNPCPFPSWANVKSAPYNAVGDGNANDTTAIQNALNDVGTTGKPGVVYFPTGTYKITNKLLIVSKINIALVGHDPADTTIKLYTGGADTSRVLEIQNTAYSRFMRLTLDGSGLANTVVEQSWYGSPLNYFDSGNAYLDNTFKNANFGIVGGDAGHGFAETTIARNKFYNIAQAGVSLRNFNALDIWIWYNVFSQVCARGVNNDSVTGTPNPYGAGNWRAYGNYFYGCTVADLQIGNTGPFSARYNTSLDSNRFLLTLGASSTAPTSVQGNTILDPIQSQAIQLYNEGPLVVFDNTVRSRGAATAPIITAGNCDSDLVSLWNTFTVSGAVTSCGRLLETGTTQKTLAELASLGVPTLPGTPPNLGRTIYEVASFTGAAIQAQIDAAVAGATTKPVVHLPKGTYIVSSTITIPANATVQLIGDNLGIEAGSSTLQWTGTAGQPVIRLLGPVKATLRDFGIKADGGKGIELSTIDQVGSRIFLWGANITRASDVHILVDGLDHTVVEARDYVGSYLFNAEDTTSRNIVVRGGPLAQAGTPASGRTNFFSAGLATKPYTWRVESKGTLLARDSWYEVGGGNTQSGYVNLNNASGTFTFDNGMMAAYQNGTLPAFDLRGFQGIATLIGAQAHGRMVMSGSGTQMTVASLGMVNDKADTLVGAFWDDTTSPAGSNRFLSNRFQRYDAAPDNAGAISDVGSGDSTFLTTVMAHGRGEVPQILDTKGAGVTDFRLYRVSIELPTIGMHLIGGGAAPSSTPSGARFFPFFGQR